MALRPSSSNPRLRIRPGIKWGQGGGFAGATWSEPRDPSKAPRDLPQIPKLPSASPRLRLRDMPKLRLKPRPKKRDAGDKLPRRERPKSKPERERSRIDRNVLPNIENRLKPEPGPVSPKRRPTRPTPRPRRRGTGGGEGGFGGFGLPF